MKTKIKRHSRSVMSIILALCMLVSCVTAGIVMTDAANIPADSAVGYGSATLEYGDKTANISLNNNSGEATLDFSSFTVDTNITCKLTADNDTFGSGVSFDQGGNYNMNKNDSEGTFQIKVKKRCEVKFTVTFDTSKNPVLAKVTTKNIVNGWFIIGGTAWGDWNVSNSDYDLTQNSSIYERTISVTGSGTTYFRVHDGTDQYNIGGQDTNLSVSDNWTDLTKSSNGAIGVTKGDYILQVDASGSTKKIRLQSVAKSTLSVVGDANVTVSASYGYNSAGNGESIANIPSGAEVTFTLSFARGYELNAITITNGATHSKSGTSYTFTMPSANTTLSVTSKVATVEWKDVYFNNNNTQYSMISAYAWNETGGIIDYEPLGEWSGTTMTKTANSNIWVIKVPTNAPFITFVGDGFNTGKLTIPWNEESCNPPQYNPAADREHPADNNTPDNATDDGYWKKYIARTNEYTVTDGSTMSDDRLFTGITATLYDYYVDGEFDPEKGWIAGIGNKEYTGSDYTWNPYKTLNSALSDYGKKNNVTTPLYFGNLNTVNIGADEKTVIEAYYNWKLDPNNSVNLDPNSTPVTGLSGKTLTNGNIHYYKSGTTTENGAEMAMFNEDFLSGENEQNKALATILRSSAFPVRKTTTGGTVTAINKIYIDPANGWDGDGAKLDAYFWGTDFTPQWSEITEKVGDYYCVSVPDGAKGVIFTRSKNHINDFDSEYFWNKSGDITLALTGADAKNLYKCTKINGNFSFEASLEISLPGCTTTGGHTYYTYNSTNGIDNAFITNVDKTNKQAKINYYYHDKLVRSFDQNEGFFPFNRVGMATTDTPDSDLTLNSDYAQDLGFGMKLEIPFTLEAGGKFADDTAQTFDFSGDDDLWVFIDNQLVLDLGGAHARTSGSIDFKNCTAKADITPQAGHTGVTRNVGFGTSNGGFFDNTNANTVHKMTIYYMERGMYDSNLMFGFSFHAIPNQLKTEKKVRTRSEDNAKKINGGFFANNGLTGAASNMSDLYIDESQKTNFEKSFQSENFDVTLGYTGSLPEGHTGVSYSINGVETTVENPGGTVDYTLQNNNEGEKMAYFLGQFVSETQITLKEEPRTTNKYAYEPSFAVYDDANVSKEFVATDGTPEKGQIKANNDGSYSFKFKPTTDVSGLENLNIRARFTNQMKCHTLVLTKTLNGATDPDTDFTVQLLFDFGIGGYQSYPLDCTVNGVNGSLNGEGKITIKSGQTISISGVPENAKVRVVEVLEDTDDYGYAAISAQNTDGTALTTTPAPTENVANKSLDFVVGTKNVAVVVNNTLGKLAVSHNLLPDSPQNANTFVSVAVKNGEDTVTTYNKTSGTIDVDSSYIKRNSNYSFVITLENEPEDGFNLEKFYEQITGSLKDLANSDAPEFTVTTSGNTATVTIAASALFSDGMQTYKVLPFFSKINDARKHITITKTIMDGKTSDETYNINLNTLNSFSTAAAKTPFKGEYTVKHIKDGTADTVVAADESRANCKIELKQNDRIEASVPSGTILEITEDAISSSYERFYHYNSTVVDSVVFDKDKASTTDIINLYNDHVNLPGVVLKIGENDNNVEIRNKAWGYSIQYTYQGYDQRYAESPKQGQTYYAKGLFKPGDFDETNGIVQFAEVTDDSTNANVWGVKFKDDATQLNFISNHAPCTDNFMESIQWHPRFEDQKITVEGQEITLPKTATRQFFRKNAGEELTMKMSSTQTKDQKVNVYFKLPFASSSSNKKFEPTKSQADGGRVIRTEDQQLYVTTKYGNWYVLNDDENPTSKDTANFVNAPEEIYGVSQTDGGEKQYTKFTFRYWSMKTVGSDVDPKLTGRISEEYKRCYYKDFNMTLYQDTIVEPVYAREGEETTGGSAQELIDTTGGLAEINFLETSRNQWNYGGGGDIVGKAATVAARKQQGDRIYCDFLMSFGFNDSALQKPFAKLIKRQATDPNTGAPIKDENGQPVYIYEYVPYMINGNELYYSGGFLLERVAEITDENKNLSQQQYRNMYDSDENASAQIARAEKYLKGEAVTDDSKAPNATFMLKESINMNQLDNKNQIEYSTSIANKSHATLEPTAHKNYVYRAYAFLNDANAGNPDKSQVLWDGNEVTDSEYASLKAHNGQLIKVSAPVYFTIKTIAEL